MGTPVEQVGQRVSGGVGRVTVVRAVLAILLRDMQVTYSRFVGGYVWAIIEPAAAILFFSVVIEYGLGIRAPGLGNSFPLFFATGYLPLALFLSMDRKLSRCFQFAKGFLPYPGLNLTQVIVARVILCFFTEVLAMIVIFLAIHAIFDATSYITPGQIVLATVLAGILGAGTGIINNTLMAFVPIWETIWAVLTRPLFIVSGVFFMYEDMPRLAQEIMWWNPITHCIAIMRMGFYPGYEAVWSSWFYVLATGMGLVFLGLPLSRVLVARIMDR